ncbi:hypothetical protein AWZ03_014844 [Drosophila navojoa]|uniref:Uncharacterized protein n=1 Tax=Drosophila navojoa TaxID=7232 RepID=A0A484AQM7_DRONA|nr:hypothetical protein AWZ03_014844 [Drosophila navojoa]
MADHSGRAQLSVPALRLIKRSASASPIPSGKPQTTSTFKRSPVLTRSSPKPANSLNMSSAVRLIKFESRIDYAEDVSSTPAAQLEALAIRRDRVKVISVANALPPCVSAPFASSGGCRLPPVDTGVLHGDYLRWPTFRDLFTAIYIQNPRLTPVEKLFHLN